MFRFLVISTASGVGIVFYVLCKWILKKYPLKAKAIIKNNWILQPNPICYFRTLLAWTGFLLYFFYHLENAAILVFAFAAILDGIDGEVARKAELVSEWGKFLDPLCDKATYLPPLASFAWQGKISLICMAFFILIELFGQFGARPILQRLGWPIGANKFGKWKTAICFGLVIYCALLDSESGLVNFGNYVLVACILLGIASIVFKFVPLDMAKKNSIIA